MYAFSSDSQARWEARKDREDAEAVNKPRARQGRPNEQFLASTVRAVDGHNRRLAQQAPRGGDATGALRADDRDDRRSDMIDERLDWAAKKAAVVAADNDDDDGSDASDDAAARRARKKTKKKAIKKEAKKRAAVWYL
jgi:hypothetical protein